MSTLSPSRETSVDHLRGYRARWDVHQRIPDSIMTKVGGLSHMLAHLLYVRGHQTSDSILDFLLGTSVNHDPWLMPNMSEAVALLYKHMYGGGRVAIYGDFDCDGITASAIMYETLKKMGHEATVVIPQRREGHGLADFRIEQLAASGHTLILTVDCGVSAVREVEHAKSLGMDIVVTDHHVPGPQLPDCLVVNPQLPGSLYPWPYLSGAGVAYKLAQALYGYGGDSSSVDDLAALGTIADIVPLRDENRSIALRGLKRMRQRERPGLVALFKASGIDLKRLDSNSVAFYIAPKINSANRMGDPRVAYELMITKDEGVAKDLAKKLGISNKERQFLLEEHFAEVAGGIDRDQFTKDIESGVQAPIIIVHGQWPPGISGLIASRLVETYGVPAVCAAHNEWGDVSASARSTNTVDLMSIIEPCSHLFRKYGGHAGAAGFICNSFDQFLEASECLKQSARSSIGGNTSGATLTIDAEISLSQVTAYACEQVDKLGPYGEDWREPLFMARGVRLTDRKTMSDGKHLSATAVRDYHKVRAVFFSHDLELEATDEDQQFDLVFNISMNMWRGRPEIQIMIRDWRLTEEF